MKPIWKKLLAAGCAAAMLITSQGSSVAAATDMYETQAEDLSAYEERIDTEIIGEVPTDEKTWGLDVNTETDAVIPDENIQTDAAGPGGNAQSGGAAESDGNALSDASELDEATQPDTAQFDTAGPEDADGADGVYPDGTIFAEDAEEALAGASATSYKFSDVQDPKHPYYKAICWAAETGITKGYEDGTFGIDRACTRSEAVMFLWRMAGKPAPDATSESPFSDVPKSHPHYRAILWASQKGITKGYEDGTFGLDETCTRGQCMMFLWRFKGKPLPKIVSESPFSDLPVKHDFYWAIVWGAQKKVTKGFDDGTFGVDTECTRGQIVTFLFRTIKTGWVKENGELRFFDSYGRMLADSKVPFINYFRNLLL